VPETRLTTADVLLGCQPEPGVISRWRCDWLTHLGQTAGLDGDTAKQIEIWSCARGCPKFGSSHATCLYSWSRPLADTLRHEHRHWRPLCPPSALLAEIRAISRDRERLVEIQHAAGSRLRATLEAYHPAPLHLFSSLDRDITLAFITDYPRTEQAGQVGPARMAAFCGRHGYSGRTNWPRRAPTVGLRGRAAAGAGAGCARVGCRVRARPSPPGSTFRGPPSRARPNVRPASDLSDQRDLGRGIFVHVSPRTPRELALELAIRLTITGIVTEPITEQQVAALQSLPALQT
jgi:hypothetical protein